MARIKSGLEVSVAVFFQLQRVHFSFVVHLCCDLATGFVGNRLGYRLYHSEQKNCRWIRLNFLKALNMSLNVLNYLKKKYVLLFIRVTHLC